MTVSAVITSSGVPVTGVDATLQFQKLQAKEWTAIASAPLGADGAVAFAPVVTDPGSWRIFVPGVPGRAEQASDPVLVQVTSVVRAKPKKVVVKAQTPTTVRVVAQPARKKQVILVQVQRGGAWKTIGRGRTDARGVVKISIDMPRKKGVTTFRATANARGGYGYGVSEPFTIRVK